MHGGELCSDKFSFSMNMNNLPIRWLMLFIIPFPAGLDFVSLTENKNKARRSNTGFYQRAIAADVIIPGTLISFKNPHNHIQI
ncbi:hypothetical protein EAI6_00680 [Enterobacter asburiae]|nr:hypothetical protein EAI6_00680 [Enterobacter asburiae]